MNVAACLLAASSVGWTAYSQLLDIADQKLHSVAFVRENIEELHGQKLLIRGWLNGCQGDSTCYLSALPGNMKAKTLTIDRVPEVEWHLGRLAGNEVILEAMVTKECTVNLCVDRAPDLIPVRAMKFLDNK